MSRTPTYSNHTASAIDDETRRLLNDAQLEAGTILRAHRETLDGMAGQLLEHETLDIAAISDVFAGVPKWTRSGDRSGAIEPGSDPPDDIAA